MYKIFKGFHLVETYQELKKAKRLAEDRTVSRIIKIVIASSIALVLWLLPINVFGVEGLTLIEQRLISIFVFATLMWVFEAVPAWTTSVLIVVLLLLTVSDSSLWFFRQGYSPEELGQTVKYKSIMHCFADPIIMLFIGGFILAIAATKSGLDVLLARVMLKPFGTQSRYVLLGFILVTALFSMFLSNTATAAMMLTFLTPVLGASRRRKRENRPSTCHSGSSQRGWYGNPYRHTAQRHCLEILERPRRFEHEYRLR